MPNVIPLVTELVKVLSLMVILPIFTLAQGLMKVTAVTVPVIDPRDRNFK